MSNAAKQRNESETDADTALFSSIKQWYHVPVLVVLMAFMLATRLRALSNFQNEGGVTFRGNDPWYHFRETTYLLDNFPSTMPFEVWTNYPSGTSADQFGTLYDQIVSGFILLTSFGNPSGEYAGLIMLIAAPVFVTATIVPTYLIAARFAGRGPALAGITVLALFSGTVLNYTLVGFYDHHAAEVFFQTLGVFGFTVALSVAQREQPVWELVADRDFDALRRPLMYSVGAGVAAALYMWAWPPGILLVGFTGIFFAVKITSDVYHEQSPEPIAFVGAVSMIVTGLLMFVPLRSFTIGSATNYTLLQVIFPLGVGFGCILLGVLARQWEARDLDLSLYPLTIGSLLVVVVAVFSSFIQGLYNAAISRIGFAAGAAIRTIGEAQPFLSRGSPFDVIYSEYGLAFFTALVAALIVLGRPLIKSDDTNDTIYIVGSLATVGLIYLATPVLDTVASVVGTEWQIIGLIIAAGLLIGATFRHRYDAAELYLLVWAAFITSAAFTQVRFNYYLAIVVAVFTAIFVAQVLDYLNISASGESLRESVQSLEGWQVMAVVAVVLILTVPLLVPFGGSAWASADNTGPGTVTQWGDSFEWMSSETPQPGTFGGANNSMEPYDTYPRPADDNFDYPEGAYGVQSWWDYGHWITTQGERIPNANPFQQGATEAANYLLAPSEAQAADALDEKMGEEGQTRYVMVDWQMASPNSKFGAPTVFYDDADVDQSDFYERVYQLPADEGDRAAVLQSQQLLQQRALTLRTQRYYDSQMIRLYHYHGSAADPEPIVIEPEPILELEGQRYGLPNFNAQEDVRTFDSLSEARDYADNNPNARLGGIGSNPTERVDALEHYRLVKASQSNVQQLWGRTIQNTGLNLQQLLDTTPNWVKTFERVPGATVEGTGAEPGEEINATVEVAVPAGQNFTYTQYATADEDGTFEMTLPYSTTGSDEFGPDNGYTNTSVQATGQYSFSTDDGQTSVEADVDEAQVVGVDESAVTVDLSGTSGTEATAESEQ